MEGDYNIITYLLQFPKAVPAIPDEPDIVFKYTIYTDQLIGEYNIQGLLELLILSGEVDYNKFHEGDTHFFLLPSKKKECSFDLVEGKFIRFRFRSLSEWSLDILQGRAKSSHNMIVIDKGRIVL